MTNLKLQKKFEKKREKTEKSISMIKMRNFLKNNITFVSFFGILLLITFAIIFNNIKLNYFDEKKTLVYGDDVIEMNYFYLSTCPHCKEQEKFHEVLLKKYPNLRINEYEMTSQKSRDSYMKYAVKAGMENPENILTPTTIIGNRYNVGFRTEETTGKILIDMIEEENSEILLNWNKTSMKTTIELRTINNGVN